MISQTIKSIVHCILNYSGYVFHFNRKSKVFYYHDIGKTYTKMGTGAELISSHIDSILNQGFKIVPNITERDNQVMICFDDGWHGIYDYRDLFIKKGLKPTIFIAVDLIGKSGYLTEKEIFELKDAGFIFESHSWSHQGLPFCGNDETLFHELLDSKIELEHRFKQSIDSICFPQGRYSKHIVDICYKSGYRKLYSSLPGGIFDLESEGVLCRNLLAEVPPSQVKYVLMGCSHVYRKRLRRLQYQKQ